MGCNQSIAAVNTYKNLDGESSPPSPTVYSTESSQTYVFDNHGEIPDNFTIPEIQVVMNNNPGNSAQSHGW
eukprot:CAMPEP_0194216414 /NCGR_PEP_ID=MMETSP0156-20130528/18931_1 /TAXON_ID=33649 /ORGANISM="Thalassionema nitzschioides, Strain L26-B" /LENGTH=70 /DNA_ID=CAMNT_0038945177 /DNA_START=89 /DNA_END=298 /DNA_ORIENTATION=-